nr:unnamed protein product [Spirometra erinaceieuropaei]
MTLAKTARKEEPEEDLSKGEVSAKEDEGAVSPACGGGALQFKELHNRFSRPKWGPDDLAQALTGKSAESAHKYRRLCL